MKNTLFVSCLYLLVFLVSPVFIFSGEDFFIFWGAHAAAASIAAIYLILRIECLMQSLTGMERRRRRHVLLKIRTLWFFTALSFCTTAIQIATINHQRAFAEEVTDPAISWFADGTSVLLGLILTFEFALLKSVWQAMNVSWALP